MAKHGICALLSAALFLHALVAIGNPGTGLEIDNPQQLYIIYTIEPMGIDINRLEAIIDQSLSNANIEKGQRDDAQLFLRVEQQSGKYLLYLDFSRKVHYIAMNQCYSKDGFVWGRYVKDITDIEELHDDIESLIEEFLEDYTESNRL